jgi:hypothetical protein
VGERRAERVVLDLADEGRTRAEARDTRNRIGARAARGFDRRPHRSVDRFRARFVDQRHPALVHPVLDEEIVLGARNHVHDGVADAEDIELKGHRRTPAGVKGRAI